MPGTTSCSVISLTVKQEEEKSALPSQHLDCAVLCKWATISLCLNYNSTTVGRPRVWWGEGDVSSSAVTFVLGGETMQTDRPTLTGLEQDVHFTLKDFKQSTNKQMRGYWVLGLRQHPWEAEACQTVFNVTFALWKLRDEQQFRNALFLSWGNYLV